MNGFSSHIYLSPHYDDASLSCGGAIHHQVQAGQPVLVITVCAAPPQVGVPLSAFAQSQHQSWGSPEDVIAARRAEDRASMTILGADYLWLNFTDCIYRGNPAQGEWYYTSNADIFGRVHPADYVLPAQMAQEIIAGRQDKVTFYAPLTVGHHVDHQLVHMAAWRLHEQGYPVAFYEDYPYADPSCSLPGVEELYSLSSALADLPGTGWQPQLVWLAEEDMAAKVESIRAYASQLPVLFQSAAHMESQVRAYAVAVGGGNPAERIWLPQAARRLE